MEWTEQRIEMLRKLWGQGQTASQIATLLGGVTRNAVIGKAHRLGLTGRPSPIKRDGTEAGSSAPRRKSAGSQRRQQPAIAPMPNIRPAAAAPMSAESTPSAGILNTSVAPEARPSEPAMAKAPSAPRNAAVQAGSKSCSWPVGDPKQAGFHFCGDSAEPGRPYCAHHCAIAYHRKSEAA